MQAAVGRRRTADVHHHFLMPVPRLSDCLDGEATLALLRTTHTMYKHYTTQPNPRASLRWHWFESPARYTDVFWKAFRAHWPDANIGSLTLWLTSTSNCKLTTLFERQTPWPSLKMLQIDASTRNSQFVITINVWVLRRACPALRTVLLRGSVELTTMRMEVPTTAIPVWAPECSIAITSPSSLPLPSVDETLPWTTVHCIELPLPGAQDHFAWLAYASCLEELWIDYQLPKSSRTMEVPWHLLDLPSTCHTLRLSGTRAAFVPEYDTDLCLLLKKGLMLGIRHNLRTLAFNNVAFNVLNTVDLHTLQTVQLDNTEGTAVGDVPRIEKWDPQKDPPPVDEADMQRYLALIAAGRHNLYTVRTVLGLSAKQWAFMHAHEGLLRSVWSGDKGALQGE